MAILSMYMSGALSRPPRSAMASTASALGIALAQMRGALERIDGDVDLGARRRGADLLADVEHRRLVHLAFADDDAALDGRPGPARGAWHRRRPCRRPSRRRGPRQRAAAIAALRSRAHLEHQTRSSPVLPQPSILSCIPALRDLSRRRALHIQYHSFSIRIICGFWIDMAVPLDGLRAPRGSPPRWSRA